MYYPFGWEFIATSYLSFSSWASSQFLAFIKETRTSSSMDAPIYSPPPSKELLAALTMASTFCKVMSPLITNILSGNFDKNQEWQFKNRRLAVVLIGTLSVTCIFLRSVWRCIFSKLGGNIIAEKDAGHFALRDAKGNEN
jgi:hypothetical protein